MKTKYLGLHPGRVGKGARVHWVRVFDGDPKFPICDTFGGRQTAEGIALVDEEVTCKSCLKFERFETKEIQVIA